VCTWAWTWITLAACNVWARYATAEACTTSGRNTSLSGGDNWNCTTDKMWLHFQWWSSTWYKFDTVYTLSTSYNYTVDSWLTSGTANTSDRWNQWPCPTWYHIPSPDEWYNVIEAWNWWWWTLWSASSSSLYYHTTNSYRSLSSWWSDIRTALKLPVAGHRSFSNGLNGQGSEGRYWSSTAHASTALSARYLNFISSSVRPGYSYGRRLGFSVRCFKD
jgi:hypothetical protein